MYESLVSLLLFGAIVAVVSGASYVHGYCADANDRAKRTGKPVVLLQFRVFNEDFIFQADP